MLFGHGRDDRLRFGEDPKNGRMVTIEEVTENGLRCGLVCPSPACGRELVACLRVTKKRPYLRHHRAPCQFAGESALHKYAKQLIQRHGSILVPKVQLEGKTLREARQLKFDSVVLEHRFHSIIPDIITNVGSHQLLIEIKVTHACDERKTAILANKSLNTVEIDLSHLERAGVPVAEFDQAILESAPRVWLYHHRIGKELEARREAQERHDIEVARAHIEQLRDRLFLSNFEPGDPSEEEQYVRIRDLGEFIDIELPGNWAPTLSATFWQAAVLRGVISELVVDGGEMVTPGELKAFLQDLPDQPFDLLDLPPRIADRVRAELPDFQSLDELARSYHQALVQRGFLDPRGRVYPAVITRANAALKRYQQAEAARAAEKKRLDAEQAQRLAAIEMERQRENRRDDARRKVEEFVSGLLEAVPRESRAGFAVAQWWDTPLASGKAPESFIQHGDAWFLLHKLEELKQLFVSGSAPLDNLFNLPLDSFRSLRAAEAETARRAKQKADAEIRQRHIEAWSRRRDQEPDWIDTPQLVLGNLSPRQVINGPDAVWRQLQVRESRKDELARQARDGPKPEREQQLGSLPLW